MAATGQARMDFVVDFVADLICPWCWIARRRLERAIDDLATEGLRIAWNWRPYLLTPDRATAGTPQAEHLRERFGGRDEAERYHHGVTEAGRAAGLEFRYDLITRTPNTLDAHRLMLLAERTGRQQQLAESIARSFFTEGGDIGDRDLLTRLAERTGLDPVRARTMLDSDDFVDEVHSMDRLAKQAGISAVPAFAMHGRILRIVDPELLTDDLRVAHHALAPSGI